MSSLVCPQCNQSFTPRDKRQRYCSRACVSAYGRQVLARMQAEGNDPAHGGHAAEARRQSLARRRAAGEPLGRAAAKAKREGNIIQRPVPEPPTAEEKGELWLEAGQRWEKRTARALARERKVTLVLTGYGTSLRVERDALVVKEGCTHNPQSPPVHTFYRAVHDVEKVICLNPKGILSFDAVRWCQSQGIAILLIGRDGNLSGALTPESAGDIVLRRRQYTLAGHEAAYVSKELISQKLHGQYNTLQAHQGALPEAGQGLEAVLQARWEVAAVPTAQTQDDTLRALRVIEGRAAAAYFATWQGLPLKWKAKDRRRVPPHWQHIRERSSPVSGGRNRHAVDPCNAILNYAYGVLEGQCRTALAKFGFDPACGVLHADKVARASLAYDLMEVFRPAVDALVLKILSKTTFTRGDFTQGNNGVCRLHPQMARYVVAMAQLGDSRVTSEARWLRDMFLKHSDGLPLRTAKGYNNDLSMG